MEFRILGALEVVEDGRPVDVGGTKQRALLAILLLHANEVVSKDRLIDALWEDEPPETAQKALQVYVSQLRKALGKERLETKAPGYRLLVGNGELDVERFQRLAEDRPREALGLWRGPPLSEFAYQRFAQVEIDALEELRFSCLERRIEEDLERGRHAALVGELERLVREQPLRERLRGYLMLALYRSGRQAEALDVYQDTRRALTGELGIEPGLELRELQQAILRQDPALAPASEPAETTHATAPNTAASPEPETRPREVRKTVTVLSCSVAATSPELDPEPLRRIMSRGFDELLPLLERYGAAVERSFGDALSAVFGIPAVHEDDALRAARVAVEMRERLREMAPQLEAEWGASLELRAGIGTGEVVTGGDGATPLATGKPVETATRLLQLARPGELLLDERTYRIVRDSVLIDRVGEQIALVGLTSSMPHGGRRSDAPMVGRERERRRLHDVYAQATGDRSCQLFTILGAPGVGKSRLVREFVADVAAGADVVQGRCLPYGEGITYWPLVEAVRDAAELDEADSPLQALDKIRHVVEGQDEADLVAASVGEVIGLSDHASGMEETFSAVRAFFEAVARQHALVLVFDDIHCGEPTFLDLVDHIAEWTRDAPILLLCVARPELLELRPHWGGGKLNVTTLLLEPLSDAHSLELVENLAGAAELDEDARLEIVAAAEGNPLFLEEMLALLLEDPGRPLAFEVPPTIQALLAARLDRLPEPEREALEAAAVEGKFFHESSVASLLEVEPVVVRPHLLALVRKELIRRDRGIFSGDRAYRFRHLLIRDAAYESIPKEGRARLHEAHARWLEEKASDRVLELEEILGYHLEQAHVYRRELAPIDSHTAGLGRRAAERLGSAGRRAFARSDAPAGLKLVSRAVALLPPEDPLRVDLIPNVRVVQGMEDLSWADKALTEAVETAATTGERGMAAHALVQRALLRLFTAREADAADLVQTARQALRVFEELGDELGLARAWRLIGQAEYLAGQAASSAAASERALAHARRADDAFEQREITEWLAIALVQGPLPAEATAAQCRRLLAEVEGNRELEVQFVAALAYTAGIQGRFDEFDELLARAEEMVAGSEWIWTIPVLAWIALARAEPARAEDALLDDYERLKRIGEKSHFSSFAALLAQAAYQQARYEQAERFAREAGSATAPSDVHTRIVSRTTLAKVLAQRREFVAAEELARDAAAFAKTTDFLHARADALSDLAEVLALSGKAAESARALDAALALLEEKGNVLLVETLRAQPPASSGAVGVG